MKIWIMEEAGSPVAGTRASRRCGLNVVNQPFSECRRSLLALDSLGNQLPQQQVSGQSYWIPIPLSLRNDQHSGYA